MRIAKLLAAVAAASIVGGASEPVRLQPSSKWVVDLGDDDSCRLIRLFGTGDSEVKLVLESLVPSDLSMMATGIPLRSQSLEPIAWARFLPTSESDAFVGRGGQSATDSGGAAAWDRIQLMTFKESAQLMAEAKALGPNVRPPPVPPGEKAERIARQDRFVAQITSIGIDIKGGKRVILETGSLTAPLKVLRLCTKQILVDLGLDPDVQARIVRGPWLRNFAQVVSGLHYPPSALFQGVESAVKARLLVDSNGKVTSCTAFSQINAPEFKKAVCEAIRARAQFQPAELADGTTAPTVYLQTVRFVIRSSPASGPILRF